MDLEKNLKTFTKAILTKNFNMAKNTSYKTGGKVKYFIEIDRVKDLRDCIYFLQEKDIAYKIIGNGSNILLSDDGYDGAIIKTARLNKIIIEGSVVRVSAGALLSDFIRLLALNGYSDLAHLYGIPASVGGAISMNAGAFNHNISDSLISVSCLVGDKIVIFDNDECEFSYRSSRFLRDGYPIIEATFSLNKFVGAKSAITLTGDVLRRRKLVQPQGRCCGSVFKNLPTISAGKLIEDCGLKGVKIGGAVVSAKHANFIMADGDATSKDVYNLIALIKQKVKENFGVTLQEEVEYLGSF